MTTPQGPDRYGADRDRDQTGPPTWGTPPPGGWGDDDAGPPTGAWDPRYDDRADYDRADYDRTDHDDAGGYVGRRRAEDRDAWSDGAPPAAPWGDQAEVGYDGRDDDGRPLGAGRPGGTDPWSDTGETVAVDRAGFDRDEFDRDGFDRGEFAPGDEPWAPREAVTTPRRGPFGLGTAAIAGIGAGIVALVVLGVLAFVTPGWLVTSTLDKTALQNGVTQVLTQDYRLQVGAVECPDDVVVEADTEFACQALVDGEQVTVPGRVTTDDGDYQISRV